MIDYSKRPVMTDSFSKNRILKKGRLSKRKALVIIMHYRELDKNYDLIVVGGGLTGVAAAVAAARQGLEVLLLEQDGSLGGALSNSIVYPFMRYRYKTAEGELDYLCAGIFKEMVEKHEKLGGNTERGWQPEQQ